MTRILCASADCKWHGDDNYCTAEEIKLSDMSIMTYWQGRQHLWECKQHEVSESYKRLYGKLEKLHEEMMRWANDTSRSNSPDDR